MQRSGPSSCQVPLALGILLLIGAAVFCFAGAVAVGVGFFYFAAASRSGQFAEVTPTPEPEISVTPPNTPAPGPRGSITPFHGYTPFKAVTPTPSAPSGALDEFGFPTAKIKVGGQTLEVELAETQEQQLKGLRFRKTLSDNAGMLFIFPTPQRVSFWMKDASIPLSIAFIEADGKVVQIRPMQPLDETPVPSLSDSIAYALMVNQGWFERNGVTAGTVIGDLPGE